jgi:hypothetical protein
MQAILFEMGSQKLDSAWLRAAIRECIAYGEHGIETEQDEHGHTVCFNCQGQL